MKILLAITYAFINTFGITQPTPEGARRAALFIGGFLLCVMIIVLAAAGFALHTLHSH